MKNKTLRFYHSDLEEQYQCSRNRVRLQMFLAVSFCYLILNLILLIENYLTPNFQLVNQLEFYLILLILLLQVIGCYLGNHIRYTICILNAIGSLMEYNLQNLQSDQTIFIFGCNLMATQIFLLKRSDFLPCLLQLTIISTIRITILVYTTGFEWFSVTSTILVSFFICAVMFNSEKRKRQQFLYHIKESHQQQLLSNIIQKPFYFFQYDHITFSMKSIQRKEDIPIYQHNFCQDCNLKHILREYMYQNMTLENYLLQLAKKREPLHNFHMICQNKRKGRIYITITELFSESHSYLLIFNPQPQQQQSKKTKLLLLNYSKDIIKTLAQKQTSKVYSICVSYLSVIYLNDYTINKFNPGKLLKAILNLLQGGRRHNIIEFVGEQSLSIYGYKSLFIVSWLQIISILRSAYKNYSPITMTETKSHIEFSVALTLQHKILITRNKILCQILPTLYSVEYHPFRLKMHKDLDISFNEYYLK